MAFNDWLREKQSFGSLISGTFKIVKLRLSHFLLIVLLVEFSGLLLSTHIKEKFSLIEINPYYIIAIPLLVTFIFSSLSGVMLTLMVGGFATSKQISFVEMLSKGIRYLPFVLFSTLILGVSVLVGFALLVLPGIAIAVYLSFYINAIVLRGKKPFDAFRFSLNLVRMRWWKVFGTLLLSFLIVFTISFFSELATQSFLISFLADLINALTSGLAYIFVCVYFLNLEARDKSVR